jgi:hypothetical protein
VFQRVGGAKRSAPASRDGDGERLLVLAEYVDPNVLGFGDDRPAGGAGADTGREQRRLGGDGAERGGGEADGLPVLRGDHGDTGRVLPEDRAEELGRGAPARVCSARPTAGFSVPPYGLASARPTKFEDATPPRFAQAVGLFFAVVGLVGYLRGPQWLGTAAGAALAAAFLTAAFGYCLGCEMYLLLRRGTARPG